MYRSVELRYNSVLPDDVSHFPSTQIGIQSIKQNLCQASLPFLFPLNPEQLEFFFFFVTVIASWRGKMDQDIVSTVSSAVKDLLGPLEERLRALESASQENRNTPVVSDSNSLDPGKPGSSSTGTGSASAQSLASSGHACSSVESVASSGHAHSSVEFDDPKHASVSPEIATYLEAEFRRGLKSKERRDILDKFPRPDTKVAVTPKLDQELLELPGTGSTFKKSSDTALFSIQSSVLDCLGPLTRLWSEAQAAQESGEGLDPSAVLELIPVALRLLGNANHKLASQRRHVFLEHLDKGLTSMAEETYESAGTALFGPDFLSRMQSKADSQKAMADVLKRFRDARAPPKTKSAAPKGSQGGGRFFRGAGVARYGGNSRFRPYNSPYTLASNPGFNGNRTYRNHQGGSDTNSTRGTQYQSNTASRRGGKA